MKKALVIRDPRTKKSKGYGFITFSNSDQYEKALSTPTFINNRKADCHAVLSKSNLKKKKKRDVLQKIFVGGIAQTTTNEDLKAYFSEYGEINDCRILLDGNSGKSRGFAFLLFREQRSIDLLLNDGPIHKIVGKEVECKLFEDKNRKRKKAKTSPKKVKKQKTLEEGTEESTSGGSSEENVKVVEIKEVEKEEVKREEVKKAEEDSGEQLKNLDGYFSLNAFKSASREKEIYKSFTSNIGGMLKFGTPESLKFVRESNDVVCPLTCQEPVNNGWRPKNQEESHISGNLRFNFSGKKKTISGCFDLDFSSGNKNFKNILNQNSLYSSDRNVSRGFNFGESRKLNSWYSPY